jgi:hypothetical protein
VPSTSLSIVWARTGVVDKGDGRRVAGGIVEAAGGGAAGNGEGGPAPGSVGRGGGAGSGGRSGGADSGGSGSSCASSEDRPLRPCGKSRKVPDQSAKSLKPQTAGSSCATSEDSDDNKPLLVKVLNRDQ